MRKLPPSRLTPMASAITGESIVATVRAAKAAEATFQQQLREANLKMPIKDAMRDLAVQMQQHLDAELQTAVERYLGEKLTDPEVIRGRLVHAHPPVLKEAAAGDACTIYCMDGIPILKAGEQVLERRGEAIHAFQLVEQLLPETYVPASRIIMA